MDFIYLFRVLLKKKWIIMGSAILAALIAYTLTANQPRNYRSSAQLSTGFTTVDEDIRLGDNLPDRVEADTKFNNVLVTLTSPTVISLLSYDLILHDLSSPTPFRKLKEEDRKSAVYQQINPEQAKAIFQDKLNTMTPLTSYKPDERKLLEFLALYDYDYKSINKHLATYRLPRTDYIQIDYLSDNPELSAFVVNDLYTQFMRYYRSIRGSQSQASIDTLKNIMEKKKLEVDIKNNILRSKGYVDAEVAATGALGTVTELEKDLASERSKKTQNEYELKKVNQKLANFGSSSSGTSSSRSNDDVVIAREAASNAYKEWKDDPTNKEKEKKYKQLLADYTSLGINSNGPALNPNTGRADTREDLLEKQSDLEFDIQANTRKIADLQSKISSLNGMADAIYSESANVETLKKERDNAQQDYLDAKSKYDQATEKNGSSVNNFRQVVKGQPAIEPEPSKRALIVALSGVAAMVTAILIIVLLTYLDSSLKTPAVFSKSVNLRLISMINFMDFRNKTLADIVANRDGSDNVHDRNKLNAFRESIRKLRYEVETSGKKIFLFTSTKKGQGKTTLIQALAYSMSISKKKILIIDTNFCNNDLTVQLNAEPILEKIVPYKQNGKLLVDQIKSFSKDVGAGTVYAIGSEGGDYTPSEILPRENLLQHLHSLIPEFDYIFLEGPPLNDFSDSKELAQYVEGVIAVFSAQQIIKQIDKQSIQFFKELNGKFSGSILNMVDLENVNVT